MKTLQQCKTCPWKKGNKCSDIPNYDRVLHESLIDRIADSTGNLSEVYAPGIKLMACHYSEDGNEKYCVG